MGLAIAGSITQVAAQAPLANRRADEDAIRRAESQYIEAAKKNDIRALTAAWTADGDYIDAAGVKTKARDLIGKRSTSADAAEMLDDVKIKSSTLRLITPEVAIEDGVSETDDGAAVRFTAVWVKQGGNWLLDSLREYAGTPAAATDATPRSDLSDLSFLAGNWIGKIGVSTYEFKARFRDDKTVLVREFKVSDGEKLTSEGTQYVSLDPVTGEVTSQSVDSNGTRASCVWVRDADGTWHGDSDAELGDGRVVRSSNYYIPNPDGTWTWSVLDATVEGQSVPDLTIKFKPAE